MSWLFVAGSHSLAIRITSRLSITISITRSINKNINITRVSAMVRAFSACVYANIQLHMTSLHDQHQHHHEHHSHLPN